MRGVWFLLAAATLAASGPVELIRAPGGGVQPQAVESADGTLHLIYLSGDPATADIYYVTRKPGVQSFSAPVRVNSVAGSAIGLGTVRGARLAVGRNGRVHVAWNGSKNAKPAGAKGETPMLYTRLNDRADGFEPERNVIQEAAGLDGGGAVAADANGNVYVIWHAMDRKNGQEIEGEDHRRVWVARSSDEGKTFAKETAAFNEPTGACGCCGLAAFVSGRGDLYVTYRAAKEKTERDTYLLRSTDHGKSFTGTDLQGWHLNACPMSTASFTEGGGMLMTAWETQKQVYFAGIDPQTGKAASPQAPPGEASGRKHPAIARNQKGETLLAWAEGTGWKRGGSLAWQLFDASGKPSAVKGTSKDLPVWDSPATVATSDGRFVVIY